MVADAEEAGILSTVGQGLGHMTKARSSASKGCSADKTEGDRRDRASCGTGYSEQCPAPRVGLVDRKSVV